MDEIEKPKVNHLLSCRVFFGILFLMVIILEDWPSFQNWTNLE
jgi:hypothetical protein